MAVTKKTKAEMAKKQAEAKKAQKKQVRDARANNPGPASKNVKGKKAPLASKGGNKKK